MTAKEPRKPAPASRPEPPPGRRVPGKLGPYDVPRGGRVEWPKLEPPAKGGEPSRPRERDEEDR